VILRNLLETIFFDIRSFDDIIFLTSGNKSSYILEETSTILCISNVRIQ